MNPNHHLWASPSLEPSHGIPGLFRLEMRAIGTFDPEDVEALAFSAADLEQLRAAIDAVLPRGEHNHAPNDPDAHVLFDSVCCGARLYRCTALVNGLPAKPTIYMDEGCCSTCGADLAQF